MSLLGNYRKKTSSDGYESLQLVDSNRDLSAGSGGGGGKQRVNAGAAAAARSPAQQPQDRASTTDSSGSAAGGERPAELRAALQLRPGPPARGSHPGPGLGEAGMPATASNTTGCRVSNISSSASWETLDQSGGPVTVTSAS